MLNWIVQVKQKYSKSLNWVKTKDEYEMEQLLLNGNA